MKYLRFQPLGRDLSRLVLGSVAFDAIPLDRLHALLDAWIACGGNIIDTAYHYGNAEPLLGGWLAERGCRDRLTIITKGAHPIGGRKRVTPEDIAADLSASLERLHTDWVDLYFLHRDDPELPVAPMIEALNEHLHAGRIRAFGASNWTMERIDEANAYAAAHGLEGFCCNSPNLSLARQLEPLWPGCVSASDAASRAWHERTQMPLFAWSSAANGFFTGRYAPGSIDDPQMQRVYDHPDNWERLRRAEELAAQKGYTAHQIALAWVLHQPFPTYALFGPQSVEELHSSLASLDVELSADEVRWLDLETDIRAETVTLSR